MLIEVEKDFYINPAHVVSAEIIEHRAGSFTVNLKLTSTSHEAKGYRNIDFKSYADAKNLIEKLADTTN